MNMECEMREMRAPLRDRALRQQDVIFRDLAAADDSAGWLCWAERLLLRFADSELYLINQSRRA